MKVLRGTFALLLPIALLSGCIGKDAGYDDVRKVVDTRAGLHVQWDAVDSSRGRSDLEKLLAEPLNGERAAEIALLNNPEVQAAFEDLGIARGMQLEAVRPPNPEVEAGLSFGGGDHSPDIRIGVNQSITGLLYMPAKNGVADAAFDAAVVRVAGRALDIAHRARIAMIDYQAAEQLVELRRTALRATKASYDLATKLHEAGNITNLDLANEQALYEETRLRTASAEMAMVQQREMVNRALGLWGNDGNWKASPRLPEPPGETLDLSNLERTAVKQSLDLREGEEGYRSAARRANLAGVSGVIPEIHAGVEAEREDNEWEFGPAIAVELPIFDQGQGEIASAEASMRQYRAMYRANAIAVRSAARTAAADMMAARDRALYFRNTLLPLRQRIIDETQLQYNAMSVGAFQLLAAKTRQIETAGDYVLALRDYWRATARVNLLLAGKIPSESSPSMSTDGGVPARSDGH